MVQLTLTLVQFKNRVKIRYPILIIVSIAMMFIIPLTLQYDANWYPVTSINNSDDFGLSLMADHLGKSYNIERKVRDLQSAIPTEDIKSKLLVIVAPDYGYSVDEMEMLNRFALYGGQILIVGTTPATLNLLRYLSLYVDEGEGRIFDRDNNYGNSSLIKIEYDNKEYMGVIPLSLSIHPREKKYPNIIYSKETSISENDIKFNNNMQSNYAIAIRASRDTESLMSYASAILDNWSLRNKYIKFQPENLEFISQFIKDIDRRIDTIIFDESHLDYLPINQEGVELNFYRFIKIDQLITVFTILIIFGALFLGNRSGLLSNVSVIFSDMNLSKRIAERLETLHLKNVPAVPLTAEERYLTENRIEMLQRGKYYFQYATAELIKYIESKSLEIDSKLMDNLRFASQNLIMRNDSWRLINSVNIAIKSAEKELLDNALKL